MASNAMNSSQLACWIPEVQSARAIKALEKELVITKCVWTDWKDQLKFGDTLNIPIVPDLGSANAVNLNTDLTLNAQNTTRVACIINQWNYKAVGVGYREMMQNKPDYLDSVADKCVYSVAKAIDYYIGDLFDGLTAGNVGTQGQALTDDVLLEANENLDTADVPDENRFLVLDPESITDMFKIDKILRDDYVAKGAVESVQGFVGRSVYGCKVYRSNNLSAHNTYYHCGGMFHKEAIAAILQKAPVLDLFDWKEKFTQVVRAQAWFGAVVARATAGVCINTRS